VVIFDPPFNPSSTPVITLETPSDGDRVQGVLVGRGIAYEPNSEDAVRAIDVVIDGVAQETATLRRARPDFCAQDRVRGCPNVGFTFLVPLARSRIEPGAHTLQLRATNGRGYFVDVPQQPLTFFVDPGEPGLPVGGIESPREGQEVSGSISIRGYAYSERFRVTGVDILIDGVTAARANYGMTRNDVCGGLTPPPPNCPRVGFTANFNSRELTNGTHVISIRVLDETGRYSVDAQNPVTITVANTEIDPPVAAMASPGANEVLTGTVKITGYAYSLSGGVARIRIYVDGYPFGEATYGSERPEICAALAEVAACPNIGFEGDLDTRLLSNGPHTILVVVDDARGNRTLVPPGGYTGVNVLVQN
jgi:hypothetical protein